MTKPHNKQMGELEVVKETPSGLAVATALPVLPVKALMERRQIILAVMKELMQEGTHFGVIPGTGKRVEKLNKETNQKEWVEEGNRVIWKPGSQILCSTFQYAPQYVVRTEERPGDQFIFWCTCELYHYSGVLLGKYPAACSTLESKYRYRWESTGEEVPKIFWERAQDPNMIGGQGFVARKAWVPVGEGSTQRVQKWMIYHRVDHSDPADYYNTCEKMSMKRSLAEGVLTATACSDLFNLPPEEMEDPDEEKARNATEEANRKAAEKRSREPAADVRTKPAAGEPHVGLWEGNLKTVETHEYKKDSGKKDEKGAPIKEDAQYYVLIMENGWRASTFSESIYDEAEIAGGLPVRIETKAGRTRGTFNVVTFEVVKNEPKTEDLQHEENDLPFPE